ncbi:MAG: cytochrome c biogenesis protein CcdA [Patescibacteria group bacterium]|nr:cytochrome c biogenesis protein CcdA [Patescibacteria group bacterium]MDE2438172.1 cytochrome c biogenesis protein CcdA [Patescibacteria group bacterium]
MIQILFALLAGMLTIASPCILPLLPILLGVSIGQTNKVRPLFIVIGFVIVFSTTAILLSILVRNSGFNPNLIRTIGIFALGVFGVLMLWPTPFERFMLRFNSFFVRVGMLSNPTKQSNISGFVLGMVLGIIWTPCAGPVLASVLTLVALQKELLVAGILLVAYAIGAGVPMLLIAYGGQYLSNKITAVARYSGLLQQIFGALIIVLSVAIYFNYDMKIYMLLSTYFPNLNPRF